MTIHAACRDLPNITTRAACQDLLLRVPRSTAVRRHRRIAWVAWAAEATAAWAEAVVATVAQAAVEAVIAAPAEATAVAPRISRPRVITDRNSW